MGILKLRLGVFADYFQFYLEDDGALEPGPSAPQWDKESLRQTVLICSRQHVGIRTARNTTVPVTVEVRSGEPALDLRACDHAAEFSLELSSGRLVVSSCTAYQPDSARVYVQPACYRVRLLARGLETVDGMDGDDVYDLVLWPAPYTEPCILKQYEGEWRGG